MFMDVSSEMIHSLLPVFLTGTLGASAALVGLIEGIAESTASIAKLFLGWLSDRLGKRKLLAVTLLRAHLPYLELPAPLQAIYPGQLKAPKHLARAT